MSFFAPHPRIVRLDAPICNAVRIADVLGVPPHTQLTSFFMDELQRVAEPQSYITPRLLRTHLDRPGVGFANAVVRTNFERLHQVLVERNIDYVIL